MKKAIIVLLVILIGIGIYIIANQNSGSAPATQTAVSNTQEQAPIQQTTTQVTKKVTATMPTGVDESKACSQQSSVNFSTYLAANPALAGEIRNYTNHFNATQGKCFMAINDTYTSPNGIRTNGYELYDVYENQKLAWYLQTTDMSNPSKQTFICVVTGGGDCLVNDIFKKDMETAVY